MSGQSELAAPLSRIAVAIASHDRREHTLRCLRSLRAQRLPPGVALQVVLVDDASTDGTAEAVEADFPEARVILGSGDLYWNGGMRTALAAAMSDGFDAYLLLNDDTHLYPHAIATLVETSRRLASSGEGRAIVVGSTESPGGGGFTYGGWRCARGRGTLHMESVAPASEPTPCDTFNGNCVLVPAAAMRALGNLDPAFTHSMGDLDLGLRARRAGIRCYIAPGYAGACESNEGRGLWRDESLRLLERWRLLLGSKGLPLREWLAFTFRHAGPLWPLYWLNPYVKFWLRALLRVRARTPSRGPGGP
jgi:GT2 family glycosyltransferase